eukprot:GHVQ01023272.1.p1 GENE.GHVQ01023272.1~~GHVQ01023272.1.p1  ORF type:complete len:204 (+),score=10.15 GHVQ01023272.1:335-946(+)
MTQDFPDASRKVNHSSLGEFNAYIDCLDSTRTSDGKAQAVPFSGRSLCFFKQYKTSLGRIIPGRVQVFTVTLPSIRLDATYIEKEFIATRLIRDLQVAVELNTVAFQTRPTPPPLFSIGNVTKLDYVCLSLESFNNNFDHESRTFRLDPVSEYCVLSETTWRNSGIRTYMKQSRSLQFISLTQSTKGGLHNFASRIKRLKIDF